MFERSLSAYLIALMSAIILASCGGGGGGGTASPTSTELNRFASLSYERKAGATCIPYQGFELTPVISGNIGTGVPSYRLLGALPTGLNFNTITGVLTGVPANINAAEASLPFVTVQLAVTGFTGTQEATLGNATPAPGIKTGAFTAFGSVSGGFVLTSASTAAGNVGVLGTISRVVTLERLACGGSSVDPIPVANLVGYGLVGTPPGASIDAATGVIRFTPPVSGSFTIQQYVDLLIDGKPARYRMLDFTVSVA